VPGVLTDLPRPALARVRLAYAQSGHHEFVRLEAQ